MAYILSDRSKFRLSEYMRVPVAFGGGSTRSGGVSGCEPDVPLRREEYVAGGGAGRGSPAVKAASAVHLLRKGLKRRLMRRVGRSLASGIGAGVRGGGGDVQAA